MKRTALLLALLLFTALACQIPGLVELGPTSQEATRVAEAVELTLQAARPPTTPTEPAAATGEPDLTAQPDLPTAVSTLPATEPPGPSRPAMYEVVYIHSGDIYLWQPGVADMRLTTHGQADRVSISPDRAWIAYTKTAEGSRQELWAVSADGANNVQIAGPEEFTHSDPQYTPVPDQFEWVPASHRLVFSTKLTYDGPGMPLGDDLREVDLDTRAKRVLVEAGQGGRFSFSPDGQRLLFARGDGFRVSKNDGSSLRDVFSFPPVSTYSEWTYLPDPVWSADSTSFRVIIPPPASLERPNEPSVIYDVPVNGTVTTVLGTFLSIPAWRVRPLLSPDGLQVSYQTAPSLESTDTSLHVANVDLSGDLVLANGNLALKSWSPDSRRLVIWSYDQREMRVGTVTGSWQSFPVGIKPYELEWVDPARYLVLSGSRDAPELLRGTVEGEFARIATYTNDQVGYDH